MMKKKILHHTYNKTTIYKSHYKIINNPPSSIAYTATDVRCYTLQCSK